MIIGAGQGGFSLLNIFKKSEMLKVKVVIDKDLQAPGILQAKKEGILVGDDWQEFLTDDIDIVIDVTGDEQVYQELLKVVMIPLASTIIMPSLIELKMRLFFRA